jgi:hypothetical protein
MPLHHHRIALNLKLRLPEDALTQHSPVSPVGLGAELAAEVWRCCTDRGLSYFPALDYFRGDEQFDQKLLGLLDDMTWLAGQIVRAEVGIKLRPVFSTVRIESMQCLCYALPSVRPGQSHSESLLAAHLTPDILRLELLVNLLQRKEAAGGLERFARQVTTRWLKESFAEVEITHAAQVA